MKKLTIRSLLALFLFSMAITSFAVADAKPNSNSEFFASTEVKKDGKIEKLVQRNVIYPIFQDKKLEGVVEVSFKINDLGPVEILKIKSDSEELVSYVKKRIDKIKLPEDDKEIGRTVRYRFVFKKQV